MAKIIGIDDSPDVLQQLKVYLSSRGHQFSYIARPEFLLKRLEEEAFDLILMDVNMPEINGLELLSQLKSTPAFKEIPVIMITAEDEEESLRKCFELGASDFIRKPVNDVVLYSRVSAVLNVQEKMREIIRNQEKIKNQELEIERQHTLHYQLRSLSASMDPHFIFNSLNAVQYYILDNESDAALEFIGDFSSLMRISLHNSTKQYISLMDEVEFLDAYLRIESRRFSKKLQYMVTMNETLQDEGYRIPPMLVQPYVENAIVHGIMNKKGSGNIQVIFYREENVIRCEVKDDGVGREAAGKINEQQKTRKGDSYGMGITRARLQLLNELEKNAFSVDIEDIFENGKVEGTRVIISFPADL